MNAQKLNTRNLNVSSKRFLETQNQTENHSRAQNHDPNRNICCQMNLPRFPSWIRIKTCNASNCENS